MIIYFGIGGQYGDIFMGEPIFRKLIQDNPEAQFVFGCSKRYGDILPLFKGYHPCVIDYKTWDAYHLREGEFSSSDEAYIKKMNFDRMYSCTNEHTSYDWPLYHHQVREQALCLGIEGVTDYKVSLRVNGDVVKSESVAISLFPNNNKGLKRIGDRRVQEIVSFVRDLGFDVIHLNGPDEPDIVGARKTNTPYWQSVKRMLGTRLLITGDTGMSWAASAYNHPTVGLCATGYWGRSSSVNWQPLNPNGTYLEAWAAKDIDMESIKEVIGVKLRSDNV